MGEKSPRRAFPVNFTAEKLDYKESLARTDNKRVHNRLLLKKSYIREHETSNLSSMNYEMRKLKHELRGIRQTSGYFVLEDEGTKRGRKKEKRSKGKHSPRRKKQNIDTLQSQEGGSQDNNCKQTHCEFINNSNINLPGLPSIVSSTALANENQAKGLNTESSRSENQMNNLVKMSVDSSCANTTRTTTEKPNGNVRAQNCSSPAVEISVTPIENNDSAIETFEGNTLRPSSRGLSKSETSLVMDLGAARDRIQHRLAGKHMIQDDADITPYMHVPPDGLPRTVYLLPPLEDLLEEAKKARYVRKIRKRTKELEQDDPERELNIDEIFSRK